MMQARKPNLLMGFVALARAVESDYVWASNDVHRLHNGSASRLRCDAARKSGSTGCSTRQAVAKPQVVNPKVAKHG